MPAPGKLLCLDTASEMAGELLECHGGPVTACAFGPRLAWAVSGGWDGHLLTWDPSTGHAKARLVVGDRPITGLAVSPDGSRIYAADMEGRLSTWNSVSLHQESMETIHARPIGGIAVAGNGKAYATAGWDGIARVWLQQKDGEASTNLVLRGHTDLVAGCKFWPDGRWLLTWSHDGTIILWDLKRGQVYQAWSTDGRRIVAADIAPNANMLAAATAEGQVLLWNLHDSYHPPVRWEDGNPLKACLFSPHALELIVVNAKGQVYCLGVPHLQPSAPPKRLGHEANCAALPVTGECLAVGGDDGVLHFLPLAQWKQCEVILTPFERIEERAVPGIWARLNKQTKLLKVRGANCPNCGRLLTLPGDGLLQPQSCPGCCRHLAFTPFSLAG